MIVAIWCLWIIQFDIFPVVPMNTCTYTNVRLRIPGLWTLYLARLHIFSKFTFLDPQTCSEVALRRHNTHGVNYMKQFFCSVALETFIFCRTLKSMSLYFLHNVITYLPPIEALTTIHVNCRNHWYLLVFQISSTMIYVVDSLNHDNDRLEAIRVANL
jgi:hypothetical protein